MSIHTTILHVLDVVTQRADKASVGNSLILAGFLPSLFTSSTLSAIYFALLIPPAAWHCYQWYKKTIGPMIKDLFK